jgi:YD repeat-containing protein
MRRTQSAKSGRSFVTNSSTRHFNTAISTLFFAVSLLGSRASFAKDLDPIVVNGTAPGCSAGQIYVVNESNPNATGCVSIGGGGAPSGSGGNSGGAGLGGGGGVQTSASTTLTVDKDNSKDPTCPQGDPIAIGSGTKVEMVTDFAMPGEMGLKFERYYMSRGIHGSLGGAAGWTDSLDFELHSVCLATGDPSCTTAIFMRPDGSEINFQQSPAAASGAFLTGPFTEVGGGGLAKLTYTANGSGPGSYTVIDEDGMVYTWTQDVANGAFPSNKGILASIKDPSGIGWAITHPSTGVTRVTHTSGRYMTLTTTGSSGGVTSLTVVDPAGNNYVYQAVSQNTSHWNLIPAGLGSVSFPGSTPVTIQYKYSVFDPSTGYAFPKGLTEVDYNGVAHDLTTYDTNHNALSTSLADGTQKTSFVYGTNSVGTTVKITNPLGHVSVYQYNSHNLPISVTGQASAHCAASLSQVTYDANDNMRSKVDNNGNTTQYTYAATGQLLQTVEAAGTAIARTTNYVWDSTPGTDRLLSVTVAGWSQTSYAYNARNRLASISVRNLSSDGIANQTLTTSYGYTLYANGMVKTMTVTHPSPGNSDIDTYQYDVLGNLTSVIDGLGHATTYSNYNGLGEPGRMVGANGNVTDFTYDGRGLLLTKTTHPNGTTAQWVYAYDQFGMVNKATAPDSEVTAWNRNAVGVLQTITHNDKDGTSTETFGYDANGDITSDTVTRNGTVSLAKTVSYDELGRPYRQQGMHGQSLTYTYDGNSNVRSTTNAMGHAASFTYDALNRVSQTTESGGASPAIPSAAPSLSAPANSNTGGYTVSWTGVTGATAYTLQQQINGGAWQTVEYTASTTWSAVGKSNGTYGYRVQACNSSGCGPWSGIASVVVALAPTSAPSVSAPANSSTGSYAVSWNSVATAISYALQEQVNGGGWSTVQASSARTWNTSGRANASYGYRVQACNASGCGPWSGTATVSVLLPPQSAPSLSVPASSTNGAYAVSWASVGYVTRYTLQEQVNGGGWSTVQATGARSWSTSGRANASYGYRVQACNASGCGPWSGTDTIAVKVVPQAPTLSAPASDSNGAYAVSWTGVAYATSHTLQEQINGGVWTSVYTGASRSWSTSGHAAGTYGYRVQACDTYGCSGWSLVRTVTVSIPIGVNGHTYTSATTIPPGGNPLTPGGGSAAGHIGIRIASGTTWQVYNSGMIFRGGTMASGPIPAAAVTVRFTWTFIGVPSGYFDGQGGVSNSAPSPTSVSSNPASQYVSKTMSGAAIEAGRTYSVKVDFFNATGANISSSTCTLTAELVGSP